MLPTYLIIGAPKAGSTSLFKYTASHPEVFGSAKKELNFFIASTQGRRRNPGPAGNWARGLEWYESQFSEANGARAIGEASPKYAMDPIMPGVPERIATILPDVKLIYIVREPVRRMVSHYVHRAARSVREDRPLAEALLDEQSEYMATSRYGHQLEQYHKHFPADQIHVVITEQLKADRNGTMRKVFEFIDVDPMWSTAAPDREYNVTRSGPPRGFTRAAMSQSWWKPAASRLPTSIKALGRRLSHERTPESELSPELRSQLEDRLRDDLESFRRYVDDPEFDCWGIC